MLTSKHRDDIFAAPAVVILLIGSATGSAITSIVMLAILLSLMVVFRRQDLRAGAWRVALAAGSDGVGRGDCFAHALTPGAIACNLLPPQASIMKCTPREIARDAEGRLAAVHRSGFTLVELMVVVAIIAILALIAIPNMLAAQVRAKTARARADIRSVVTALEAYRVDHNHYPTYHYSDVAGAMLEFHIGGTVPGFGVPDPDWRGANPITTPVAYLTSMPEDPFVGHRVGAPPEVRQYLYVNWPYAVQCVTNEPQHTIFRYAAMRYGSYRLHSRGPDGDGPDSGTPYDPTNGIVSSGDITYGQMNGFDHFIPFP
ncbi:MAG: prepilin-type N-terminal cleavage/methylation domain-containing protein [Candidatus Sumerlaeaceae bacterium]|nr:prepilin-type N-terminal cleavage/methylation domain-containing protein [Candidatus Sumerlaeaceae bacterium]